MSDCDLDQGSRTITSGTEQPRTRKITVTQREMRKITLGKRSCKLDNRICYDFIISTVRLPWEQPVQTCQTGPNLSKLIQAPPRGTIPPWPLLELVLYPHPYFPLFLISVQIEAASGRLNRTSLLIGVSLASAPRLSVFYITPTPPDLLHFLSLTSHLSSVFRGCQPLPSLLL